METVAQKLTSFTVNDHCQVNSRLNFVSCMCTTHAWVGTYAPTLNFNKVVVLCSVSTCTKILYHKLSVMENVKNENLPHKHMIHGIRVTFPIGYDCPSMQSRYVINSAAQFGSNHDMHVHVLPRAYIVATCLLILLGMQVM